MRRCGQGRPGLWPGRSSTRTTWPETKAPRGPAKNSTTRATSSTGAMRSSVPPPPGAPVDGARCQERSVRVSPGARIHRHVVGPHLVGQAAREVHGAGLGRGVDRAVGAALEGRHRTDGDDASAPALHHAARHLLAHEDGAQQVAVEHGPHVLRLDVHDVVGIGLAAGRGDVAAGIVHQDVDRPELGHRREHGALDVAMRVRSPRISPSGRRARRSRAPHRSSVSAAPVLRWPVFAHAVHGDVAAQRRQSLGEGAPQPAPAPVTSATWPSSIRSGMGTIFRFLGRDRAANPTQTSILSV